MQSHSWSLIAASGPARQSQMPAAEIQTTSGFAGEAVTPLNVQRAVHHPLLEGRSGRFRGYHPIYAN